MKIGVLTYFWDENPGTLLQAYALTLSLKHNIQSADVELINYQHQQYKLRLIRNYFKYKMAFNDFKKRIIYSSFKEKHLKKSAKKIISSDLDTVKNFLLSANYDVVVVGSDTVWQLSKKKDRPAFPNIYWLPIALKCKKFAFAVSSNVTDVDDLSREQKELMSNILNDFSLIGVRDSMTQGLVDSLEIKDRSKIYRTPDPTFLIDEFPATDIEIILKRSGISFKKPVLGLNFPSFDPHCEKIIRYYKQAGFEVLSFVECPMADAAIPWLGPFEWAASFRYLDFVITDRFHGTVFSLKNLVPVLAVDWNQHRFDKLGNSKTKSLLADFGLAETHHFNSAQNNNVNHLLEKAEYARKMFNHEQVQQKVQEMNKSANSYLQLVAGKC